MERLPEPSLATKHSRFKSFKTSPEIIRLAVMMYARYPLSLCNVRGLLHERGVDICQKTVRLWRHRFGPVFAAEVRKCRARPDDMVTDRLRSFGVALWDLGISERQETGLWANSRAGNSHPPFRRRGRAMLCVRLVRSLQKFASVHASVLNPFNRERSLDSRQNFRANRSAAVAEGRDLCAA